ncbi:MAG: FRG domain-containing protein [Candidatus Heimdallarchaeota archaeon]|nr:FRG domain-containing protein [Candidatus Heimdallarchaeota archaeon]
MISGLTGLLHTRFRGEARYHENPCLPIIARNILADKDEQYEIREIKNFIESKMADKFRDSLASDDITWWMLTQHHSGFDTRLLDITRNALIALYFACEHHPDKDGYVYVFHSIDKTSVPLNPSYTSYQEHIIDPDHYYKMDSYCYMRPPLSLDRINRQEGEFLWIKNYSDLKRNGLFETNQIIPILIKKEYKAKLLRELNDPQGINPEYLRIENMP